MDGRCCRFLRETVGIDVLEGPDTIGLLKSAPTVDVIVLWQVIEHLPDPWGVIAAAVERLAPNGLLIIDTPNPEAFQFRVLGSRWAHVDAPRHVTPYSGTTARPGRQAARPAAPVAHSQWRKRKGLQRVRVGLQPQELLHQRSHGEPRLLHWANHRQVAHPDRTHWLARKHLYGRVQEGIRVMKFSVLLPTRDRLEYLRYAVETVRRQDYAHWEIIISDNCSGDDIAGYVSSLNDARIKYFRTEHLVPVTDNWNNALRHSDGDYVVMLGDDDGLLPGYFSTLVDAFQTYRDVDYAYVGAYFFAYPGAVPTEPDGFLRRDRNALFTKEEPSWLDTALPRR